MQKKGPPYFHVREPFGPIKFDMTEAEMAEDMKRTYKRHEVRFEPHFDRGVCVRITLIATNEAMADIAEWAKME